MKTINITSTMDDAGISSAIALALAAGFTHAAVTAVKEFDTVYQLHELPGMKGLDVELTLGHKPKGEPFVAEPAKKEDAAAAATPAPAPTVPPAKTPVAKLPPPAKKASAAKLNKRAAKAAAPAKPAKPAPKVKAAKAPKAPAGPRGTGFIAYIDELLLATAGTADGFKRSKHTVDEALALVMTKYPEKTPASVKKVIKVRPRHLERRKDGKFDNVAGKRAPRWGKVEVGANNSMAEIDAAHAKKVAPATVAAGLSAAHGRDPKKVLATVKARFAVLDKRAKAEAKKAKAK